MNNNTFSNSIRRYILEGDNEDKDMDIDVDAGIDLGKKSGKNNNLCSNFPTFNSLDTAVMSLANTFWLE
ncbi:unnamed protein product [Debaryomyces tyrocola]|nr:unnamed protein product [Debaryomyces tyrocola]